MYYEGPRLRRELIEDIQVMHGGQHGARTARRRRHYYRIVRDAVDTPIALDDDGPTQPDIAPKGQGPLQRSDGRRDS